MEKDQKGGAQMRRKITVIIRSPWVECRDWIPISGQYLVYYPNCKSGPYVAVDLSIGQKFMLDDSDKKDPYFGAPSHWMALPKLPEEYNG